MSIDDNSPQQQIRGPEHPTLSTSLLDGARRMDPESWSRLVTTFGPIVYGWSRASGVEESDAADIVQNVFATVARRIGDFERQKESGSFRSWLATITRSRVKDHFRRKANRDVAVGGTDALNQMRMRPENLEPADLDSSICITAAHDSINRRVMESVRAEFESKTWQAFWLTTIDGKTGRETSDELGISVASVYQAKSRVLRRMRQRLSELPD